MMNGIDVSNYQGNIDWKKVKASGKEFVIIRAGWGQNNVDPKFTTYIEGAIKEGFNIGIYWFLYGKSEKDVINNAIKCDSVIGKYRDKINLKVWADWEYDSDNYCKNLSKATRTQWTKAFCKKMEELGYDAGIYANPDYIKNKFNDISEYPLWLAYYANNKGSYNPLIWQNSSKGKVNGISGNVDTDIFYGEITNKDEVIEICQTAEIKPCTVAKNPYKEPIAILKKGSTGEGVRWVQWQLRNLKGYKDVVVDGIFGNITDKRVREVQKNAKISIDGKVGIYTRKALK